MPQFDAYEDLVGKWRWRLLGTDGRTVATSGESFDSHWHALRAAENVRGAASGARISSVPAASSRSSPMRWVCRHRSAAGSAPR